MVFEKATLMQNAYIFYRTNQGLFITLKKAFLKQTNIFCEDYERR